MIRHFHGEKRYAIQPNPPVGETVIELKDIHVKLGSKQVLKGINLEIKTGELLILVGPNGAGKSTLLGVLSSDVDYRGTVEIAGRKLPDWTLPQLARFRSVLPQHNLVSFPFSVQDVVEMGRAPWRRTELEAEDEAAVSEAMQQMEVTGFADRPYTALSGGERARVSIARVLAQRAPVMFLDEPTAALDIRHQEEVLRIARKRADEGNTVVVVLHDLSLAAAYADKIVLLSDGNLHSVGSPTQVLTSESVSEVYRHPVTVIASPSTGTPLVVPDRQGE